MDSFEDLNSSPAHRALPHVSLLADLVHSSDEREPGSQADNFISMRPPPGYLSSKIWDDYEEDGGDALFKAFPIVPGSTGIPQSSDSLSFFPLESSSSDAETGSKVSSESSSSVDVHSTFPVQSDLLTFNTEGTSISNLKTYNNTKANCNESLSSRKRKRPEEQKNTCTIANCVKKKRKVTKPSKFCHICVRSCDQVTMVPCVNVAVGHCRKNICKRCFEKHGIGHEWVSASKNLDLIRRFHSGSLERLPDDAWTCLHCRKMCPSNAQCTIYQRTNRKRHESLQHRRSMRLEREREIELQMRAARLRQETLQHNKLVESFISPADFSNLPLPVPLPPDILEGDRYFRNGTSHAAEEVFSPLQTTSEAGASCIYGE